MLTAVYDRYPLARTVPDRHPRDPCASFASARDRLTEKGT